MPTRDEVTAFEQPDFDLQQWIDTHLQGEDYVDRLTRIYSDLLRPQINGFRLNGFSRVGLSMVTFRAPDGKLTRLYFRPSQQRARVIALKATLNADTNYKSCVAIKDPVRDPLYVSLNCAQYEKYDNLVKANMCLSADEMGMRFNGSTSAPLPYPAMAGDVATTPPRVNAVQSALDANTKVVKPWWLYSDYAAGTPTSRYDATWAQRYPGYILSNQLLKEPDNTTDTMTVRVCNEEVQAVATGAVDGKKNPDGTPVMASCLTGYGAASSSACGCGPGLSWCMPVGSFNSTQPGAVFVSSRNVILGVDDPTDQVNFSPFDWQSLWMSQEPLAFFNRLFGEDRDFREVVTGRWTMVNGPLSQFYRLAGRSNTLDADLGQTPLPTDSNLPKTALPMDVMNWTPVEDRGPNAAGILTQAWFDMKNSTQRARAHMVYNAFVCRDFVAPPGLTLSASPEPDLSKRSGCAVCHHTLEPLSAYFSHVAEGDWTWLDAKTYPTQNAACKQTGNPGKIPGSCASRYDNVFSTSTYGMLRGAYSSTEHADGGPAGLGQYLTNQPEFSSCTVQNIAQSFLGRDLRSEDTAFKQELADAFTAGGYKVRPLVKAILNSKAYKSANNWNSTVWRSEGK